MKDVKRAQDLIGSDVYDRDGDRIGRVGNVYVDDASHQPEWVTVRTGMFGTKESFVPLTGAERNDRGINVGVTKEKVREAPRVEVEQGHLSDEEGRELYSYYGMQPSSVSPQQRDVPQQQSAGSETAAGGQSSESGGTSESGMAAGAAGAGAAGAAGAAAGRSRSSESSSGTQQSSGTSSGMQQGTSSGTSSGMQGGTTTSGTAAGTTMSSGTTSTSGSGTATSSGTASSGTASSGTASSGTAGSGTASSGTTSSGSDTTWRTTHPGRTESSLSTREAGMKTLTRAEERLRVNTEQVESGRVRVRKYVVTEQQTVTVPLSREEVRIEREPISESERSSMSTSRMGEEEQEVVLHEDRPVVTKETVPVERIRVRTETVTEERTVQDEVRAERFDVQDSTGRHHRSDSGSGSSSGSSSSSSGSGSRS